MEKSKEFNKSVERITCGICGVDCSDLDDKGRALHILHQHPVDLLTSPRVMEAIAGHAFKTGARTGEFLKTLFNKGK